LHARLLDLIFMEALDPPPAGRARQEPWKGGGGNIAESNIAGAGRPPGGEPFFKKIGKDEPFSPVWMR
jgi:hypothetical protein